MLFRLFFVRKYNILIIFFYTYFNRVRIGINSSLRKKMKNWQTKYTTLTKWFILTKRLSGSPNKIWYSFNKHKFKKEEETKVRESHKSSIKVSFCLHKLQRQNQAIQWSINFQNGRLILSLSLCPTKIVGLQFAWSFSLAKFFSIRLSQEL